MSRSKIILIILFLIPIVSFALWFFSHKRVANIIIYDKTVLNTNVDEHKSFDWVLNHLRFVTSKDSSKYSPEEDYYGFFPKDPLEFVVRDFEGLKKKELDSIADTTDILYMTDTYGIYELEWFGNERSLERSSKIYGGTTEKDLYLLQKLIRNKKLVLTEFNLFASPTPRSIGRKTEMLLNINWSRWTGRYFNTLDTNKTKELPKWLLDNYLEQHNNEWPFKKGGIVFVHSSDRVEILESENELIYEIPWIVSPPSTVDKYGVSDTIEYPFWFDINSAETKEDIISYYSIKTNQRGDSLLKAWKIPKQFPAAITGYDSLLYYFCGDFSDNEISMNTSYFKGVTALGGITHSEEGLLNRSSFFWDYYNPMISTILNDYSERKKF